MTSDAKVGLLLGLVFIFIIAFVINGLPLSGEKTNNNQLTTNMVNNQNAPGGIATRHRRVSRELSITQTPAGPATVKPVKKVTPRFEMKLPVNFSGSHKTDDAVVKTAKAVAADKTVSLGNKNVVIKSVQPARAKFYVVSAGDNLASIARRFYGAESGNRLTNIERIFKANRGALKSPDEIYLGQKLIIPPLAAHFEPVSSVGKRHIPAARSKQAGPGFYVVKTGDSLWTIAKQQLSNPSRYYEIARLNSDILDDRDNLVVGMRLKLPSAGSSSR